MLLEWRVDLLDGSVLVVDDSGPPISLTQTIVAQILNLWGLRFGVFFTHLRPCMLYNFKQN